MSAQDGHLRSAWTLDPDVVFLNHGSFGACPRRVLRKQSELRDRLEREPVRFFLEDYERLMDRARTCLAGFLGADPDRLAWVSNATAGVNTVLRSFDVRDGDEILYTDHAYGACRNAVRFVAERRGARAIEASVPFPCSGPDEVAAAVLSKVGPRTRLALLDHVTSPTAMAFPLDSLVRNLEDRGVAVLVDGAHAPGMLELDLERLGASYYTGNCHKWLCAPKGAGFLWARRDRVDSLRPLAISHGAAMSRPGRSRFRLEFDWTGTGDPTPWLAVPEALRTVAALAPGGWPEVYRRNRAMALEARRRLCEVLGCAPPVPDGMIGSMATVPLPDDGATAGLDPFRPDPLQRTLYERYRIQVPVQVRAAVPRRLLRISAQLYNRSEEYDRLAEALAQLLPSASN